MNSTKEGIFYDKPHKTLCDRCQRRAGCCPDRLRRQRFFRAVLRVQRLRLCTGFQHCRPGADATENGTADLDSAVETLLAANPISNQFEIAAMNIEYDFGLKAEDVAAYKGVKSNDNGDAGLVLVVEAASGKAQDVVTALESYKQDQVAFYGNYAEFAQAQSNVENAIISSKGDRVVMVIASNACSADLNSAVDSALNS